MHTRNRDQKPVAAAGELFSCFGARELGKGVTGLAWSPERASAPLPEQTLLGAPLGPRKRCKGEWIDAPPNAHWGFGGGLGRGLGGGGGGGSGVACNEGLERAFRAFAAVPEETNSTL